MKKFFALIVAAMMLATLTVPAAASTYDPAEAAEEFNATNPNLYWDGTEVNLPADNDEISAYIYSVVRLSSAQKIISLTERLAPVMTLEQRLEALRIKIDIYGDEPMYGDLLGSIQQTLIEFGENPNAKHNLAGKFIGEMSATEVLEYGTAIVENVAFQDLMGALTPEIVNPGKNIVALKAAMTDEELDEAWENLRSAAECYYPNYTFWLESFELLMPNGTLGYPVAGQPAPNAPVAAQ